MKISILIITFLVSFFDCYSQRMYTDSTFYGDGKLMSFGKYDSLHKYWKYYELYETGKFARTRTLEPTNFLDIDTSIAYHRNGNIAWIFPYDNNGLLTGKLIGYYQNSSIKCEAYFYNGFRSNTWKEYYQDGKIKSISQYEISSQDSLFNRKLTSVDYKNGFAVNETFSWGELNDLIIYDGLLEGQIRLTITTLISKKNSK